MVNNNIRELFKERKRILITGGAGFIGGAVIRRLIREKSFLIFNLDKLGYASNLKSIEKMISSTNQINNNNYKFLKVDLSDINLTREAVKFANPDLVMHLAAESHVDRSIAGPIEFINSNIIGTFNLLESIREHFELLPESRRTSFRFHHISTDEVFGSLSEEGYFVEETPYSPRSPYSASKASSDHLVQSWFHTYGIPIVITNCSNNYGPRQFPEKLIPLTIINALLDKKIPLYGDGKNVRDWLYVDDHVEALILAANRGEIGECYCIGGNSEKNNLQIINMICKLLDELIPHKSSHSKLIEYVKDRPGHDRRYAINPKKIKSELGWMPSTTFEDGLFNTVNWYINNKEWWLPLL